MSNVFDADLAKDCFIKKAQELSYEYKEHVLAFVELCRFIDANPDSLSWPSQSKPTVYNEGDLSTLAEKYLNSYYRSDAPKEPTTVPDEIVSIVLEERYGYTSEQCEKIKIEHEELFVFMLSNGIADKETRKSCFCGVINFNNDLFFFQPKTFQDRLNAGAYSDGKVLIDVIRKYSIDKGSTVSFDGQDNEEPIGPAPVIAIEVLQDYMKHGLYRKSDPEIKKQNSGKIAWSKVIKDVLPFVRKDGTPIYTNLYSNKINYQAENEVTIIHSYIVSKLDRIFGWYFTSNTNGVAPEYKNAKLPYSNEKALSFLKKELSTVFADRDIRLLRNLERLMKDESLFADSNNFYSGIKRFEHVWEEMCRFCFGDEMDRFAKHIPYPAYLVGDTVTPAPENRQRMDIIISEEGSLAILDAKYYDFSYTKPAWGDLVKQFYYKHSMAAVFKDTKISNFFIVPGQVVDTLAREAFVIDENGDRLDNAFGNINILYLDAQELLRCYLDGQEIQSYRKMIFSKTSAEAAL